MSATDLFSVLITVYAGIGVLALLLFLLLIARFYQMKSGQRSYYFLFIVPAVLFPLGALGTLWDASTKVTDWLPNALFLLAGTITIVLGGFLSRLMTGGRR